MFRGTSIEFFSHLTGDPSMTKGITKPGAASPFPPLTTASTLLCPHGGVVNSIPTGPPPMGPVSGGVPLRQSDPCVVAGCGHQPPCVRAQWVGGMSQTLDMRSIGLCWSSLNTPQGTVVIAKV